MRVTTAFHDLSLQTKLVVVGSIATASALAIACCAFVTYDYLTFRDSLARKLASEAAIVAASSAPALVVHDPQAARASLEGLRAEPHVTAAALYTRDGALFAALAPAPRFADAALPSPVVHGHERVRGELRVLQPITVAGDLVGTAAIWAGLDELYARAASFVAITLLVLLVALILVWAISSWPKRILLQPILGLTATARSVGQNHDYSLRLPVRQRDELGTMAGAFNEMMSQIQRHGAQLQSARDAAVEASRLKSAYLANMSHEIRTPLNIIMGYNELIGELVADSGSMQANELFEPVRRASQRLLQTINGILDIAKIETSQFSLDPRPLELAPAILLQEQELRVMAEQRGVHLAVEIREPHAAVVFDEYCLTHALMNLINNALKFTEDGEVVITLYRHDNGQLAIDVRDTGVGIDDEYLPKLFDPFSRASGGYARQVEGTGLGLALTKSYLELNGATVAVRSEKGKGSVFTITFSAASEVQVPEPPPAAVPAAPHPALTPPPPPDRPLILVVEDDVESRTFLRAILSDHYRVVEAASGEEVRQLLGEHGGAIRAILMDLSLKGDEDGLQITTQLRNLNGWHEVPIIATTAHAFDEDRERALAAGCDGFLSKPIQPQILLETIREAVEGEPGSAG